MSGKEAHEMMAERQEILDRTQRNGEVMETVTKVGDDYVTGAVRLQLDFPTPESLFDFVDCLRMEFIPEDVSLYSVDSVDSPDEKIPDKNKFVMRETGERPESSRLRMLRTYEASE